MRLELFVLGELRRREGWEGRLANLVETARAKPYQLGEHDCFRVACLAVEALTLVDPWPHFAGRYKTRRQALAMVAAYGPTFTSAFSRFFGGEPIAIGWARRGDVCEYRDETGEAHLGVVLADRAAVLGDAGLAFVRRRDCLHAWRIG